MLQYNAAGGQFCEGCGPECLSDTLCGARTVVQVRMTQLLSDISLKIKEFAMRTIPETNKKVDIQAWPL